MGVAMKFFIVGQFFLLIACLVVVWMLFDPAGALAANVLLVSLAVFLIRQYRIIRRAFVTGLPATTGHIQGDPVRGYMATPRCTQSSPSDRVHAALLARDLGQRRRRGPSSSEPFFCMLEIFVFSGHIFWLLRK